MAEERLSERGYELSNKELRKLIIPLLGEQIFAICVGLADSLMVAGVSNAAVSAVSLVDSVSNLIIFIFSAFATGGAVVAGQYLGRRDEGKARCAAEQLVVVLAVLSLLMMTALYLGKNFVLTHVFGEIEADVMLATRQYYSVVIASIPFIALYNAGSALMCTMQRSDVILKVSLLMNGINICGNAILIYGFHMGVIGAAIPTLCSRTIAAVVILSYFRKPEMPLHMTDWKNYRYNPLMVKSIFSIGLPSGLENGMFHCGRLILTSLISTFGTASIMANAMGNTVGNFHFVLGYGIGLAMTSVTSRCVGAGDYDAVRRYTRKLLKWAYLYQGVFNLLVLLCLPLILRVYHVEGETARLAMWVIALHNVGCIVLYPPSFPLANILRSAGDAKSTMIVTVLSMWIFRVGFGYVLGAWMGFGVLGVYMAQIIDWTVRSICFVTRYRGTKWQHAAVS